MRGGHRLHPHRLPDAGRRRVEDAAGIRALLADGLAGRVGLVMHTDHQLLRTGAGQRVRDVDTESVEATLVGRGQPTVHIHGRLVVHGLKMEQQTRSPTNLPAIWNGEGTAVPHPTDGTFDSRQGGLHRIRHQDPLGQIPTHRRCFARRIGAGTGGELPHSVEVLPAGTGERWSRILGQRIVRRHFIRPRSGQRWCLGCPTCDRAGLGRCRLGAGRWARCLGCHQHDERHHSGDHSDPSASITFTAILFADPHSAPIRPSWAYVNAGGGVTTPPTAISSLIRPVIRLFPDKDYRQIGLIVLTATAKIGECDGIADGHGSDEP